MIQLEQITRRLLQAPAFTLMTVVTLAIGIGATTAIFSVVNGILIKPLPFPESERLIALVHASPLRGNVDMAASPALYFTYREHNETFESVALWSANTASITGAGDPEEVQRLNATFEFLPTLRVRPLLGRTFTEAEDRPAAPRTVILSYAYWQRQFGGAASALGQPLTIDGAPHTIIGVMPPDFRFLQQPAAIIVPAQPNRAFAFAGPIGERAFARLKDGVTLAEASADVERMIPIWIETFPIVPGLNPEALEGFGPNLRLLKDDIVGELDDVLWVLMGTIGILLLIACANVANLQLVRTEGRGQELAIRTALGAGWGSIARNLLLESALLGLVGGAVGLAVAALALPLLLAFAAQDLPRALAISIDGTVLLFTLGISLLTALLFGSIPVVKYARPRIASTLGGTGRAYSTTRERHRARNALVVAQVTLALVLLVAAGLMIRTFQSLRDVDPGFTDPERIQTMRISIPQATERDFAAVMRTQNAIQDRIAGLAGVESVGFASRLPLAATGPDGPFSLEHKPGETPVSLEFRYTSPGIFESWGTPLLAGRSFEWADNYEDRQVAVVSEAFARREWGSPAGALGERLRRSESSPWLEIVGVVGDVRHDGLERAAEDSVYIALSEGLAQFAARNVFYFVRSDRVGTAGFTEELQRAVWSVNGNLPVASLQTMGEIHAQSMARTSLTLILLAITAGMALLLGLVGIYGVISYMLARRTREIGIRMALGARHAALRRMLLGQVTTLVVVGIMLGIGGAAVLSRLMESLLFGVTTLDPVTYVSVCVILLITAAVAGYLPARRVTHVDPMLALREE